VRKLVLAGVLVMSLTGWVVVRLMNPPAEGIRFFDVGQGDAALVSSGQTQLLIDGGPDRTVLGSLGKAMPLLDRRIEYVILSHPHTDHYRGLIEVVKRYQIGTLIVGVPGKESEYRGFINTAKERGAKVIAASGQRISLSSTVRAEIIEPLQSPPDQPVEDPNNASVMAMVTLGSSKVLMTGDAGFEEERRILGEGRNIDADVLKVGHHGSRTSSSEAFLAAVSPHVAVISSGAGNKYGHPTAEALARLNAAGIRTYRTDQYGTITLRLSGAALKLER
jgi:competence protein ComEC